MNTCKTCKHWTKPSEDDIRADDMCTPRDQDTYEPMERGFEVRICRHPEYMTMLATGQDFGCVRHESD